MNGHDGVRDEASDRRTEPKLLDRVRQALRVRHYSRRTEDAYVTWIRRFILFHGKRHPKDMGQREIAAFLSSLAISGHVSASTQNQAASALLFLYAHVLDVRLADADVVVRAQRPSRLPVVLARAEAAQVLGQLQGRSALMAGLLYGSGLRLRECVELRGKDWTWCVGTSSCATGRGRGQTRVSWRHTRDYVWFRAVLRCEKPCETCAGSAECQKCLILRRTKERT
jgi:site-specific recombinase XerD